MVFGSFRNLQEIDNSYYSIELPRTKKKNFFLKKLPNILRDQHNQTHQQDENRNLDGNSIYEHGSNIFKQCMILKYKSQPGVVTVWGLSKAHTYSQ